MRNIQKWSEAVRHDAHQIEIYAQDLAQFRPCHKDLIAVGSVIMSQCEYLIRAAGRLQEAIEYECETLVANNTTQVERDDETKAEAEDYQLVRGDTGRE